MKKKKARSHGSRKLVLKTFRFGPYNAAEKGILLEEKLVLFRQGKGSWKGLYTDGIQKTKKGVIFARKKVKKKRRLSQKEAAGIFHQVLSSLFGLYPAPLVCDGGMWELRMSDEGGTVLSLSGAFSESTSLRRLSFLLRQKLSLPSLGAFDGNWADMDLACLQVVVTREKGDGRIQRERLTCERAEGRILWEQSGAGGMIQNADAAEKIAEEMEPIFFSPLLLEREGTEGSVTVIVTDGRGTMRSYGWTREEAAGLSWYARLKASAGALFPERQGHAFLSLKKDGDLIYCQVTFQKDGMPYTYLAQEDVYIAGDKVKVPVGEENRLMTGRIVSVAYGPPEKAPYPLDRIKMIQGPA